MSTTRVRPKHQITIPEEVARTAHLEVGDILEVEAQGARIILMPKKLAARTMSRLTPKENKLLVRVRQKIARIRKAPASARGLTSEEAEVAARGG